MDETHGFFSKINFDCGLLGYDTVYSGRRLPAFQSNVLSPSSGSARLHRPTNQLFTDVTELESCSFSPITLDVSINIDHNL